MRMVLPLSTVAAAGAWLVYSVTHLIASATAYHVRVVAPPAGAAAVPAAEVQRLLAEQNHFGILAMFAVAAVAGALVLTLVTWLLGGRPPPVDRR